MKSPKRGRNITTLEGAQLALRAVGFCYMCGEPLPLYYLNEGEFASTDPYVNEDHVFAQKIFSAKDRNFPLKLRVHRSCHDRHSDNDNSISELFKLYNSASEYTGLQRLDVAWEVDAEGRAKRSQVENLPMKAIAHRWLKGVHAALYNEYLPDPVRSTIVFPFKEYNKDTAVIVQPDARHYETARLIIKNRDSRNLDRIVLYNQRLTFECVWKQQGSEWVCCFALEIDGWSLLADEKSYRTCVGAYVMPRSHPPVGASVVSVLIADPANVTLDLFPEDRHRYLRQDGEPQKKKIVESKRRPPGSGG